MRNVSLKCFSFGPVVQMSLYDISILVRVAIMFIRVEWFI